MKLQCHCEPRRGEAISTFSYEIATLLSVARNGHNTIRMLLFPYITAKQFPFKHMLLNKLKRIDKPYKLPSYCHLLNRFNKHG